MILTLAVEAAYCGFLVLVVLSPDGTPTPVLFRARDLPMELLIERRLYAIEGWIAGTGLALYLGLTEVLPAGCAARVRRPPDAVADPALQRISSR